MIDIEEKKHAKFSPSARSRWSKCPLSVDHQEHIETPYAREGTVAHDLLEKYLKKQRAKKTEEHTPEMVNIVRNTERRVFDLLELEREYIYDEQVEVPVGNPTSSNFGTVDWRFSYIEEDDKGNDIIYRVLDDFKYGKGIPVEAYENPQLLNYAVLDYQEQIIKYKGDENKLPSYYVLVVDQPRKESLTKWIIPIEIIKEEVNKLKKEIKQYDKYKKKGVYVAGDHCLWCTYKPDCGTYIQKGIDDSLEVLNASDKEDLKLMKEEEKIKFFTKIFLAKKQVERFYKEVEGYLFEKASESEVKGLKIVRSRSNRVWTNEEKVAEAISTAGKNPYKPYVPKLIGITEAEKILGKPKFKKLLGELTFKPEGKLALVPESHKSPAVSLNTVDASIKALKES